MALPTMLLWELQSDKMPPTRLHLFRLCTQDRQNDLQSSKPTAIKQREMFQFSHENLDIVSVVPYVYFIGHHFTHEIFKFPTILYTFHKQINSEVWFLEKDKLITKYKYIK